MSIPRQTVLDHLKSEYQRTRHYLGAFRAQDMDFKPTPDSMSVRQLGLHLMGCHNYLEKLALEDSGDFANFQLPYTPADAAELVGLFDDHYRRVRDGLERLPEDKYNRMVSPFGHPQPLSDIVMSLIIHEAHHRGQLGLCHRLLGQAPPDIYMGEVPAVD